MIFLLKCSEFKRRTEIGKVGRNKHSNQIGQQYIGIKKIKSHGHAGDRLERLAVVLLIRSKPPSLLYVRMDLTGLGCDR